MTPGSLVADPALNALSGAFDAFRDGVFLVDEDGEINLANKIALEQLGYAAEDLQHALLFTINPHLTLFNWKKTWKRLKEGEVLLEEAEFMHTREILLPVQLSTKLLSFGEKDWAMITIDFLLESRRYYHLLNAVTETGGMCSWEMNMVNKQLTFVGAVEELLGLPPNRTVFDASEVKEVLGQYLPPEDFAKLRLAIKQLIESGESFETEVIFNRANGTFDRLQILAQAYRTDFSTTTLFGTIQPAVQGEQTEETSYLSRFTLDHVSDMVFWIQEDGSIAYVNNAVCERLGYTRKELLKMKSKDIAQDYGEANREELWAALRERKHLEGQFTQVTKSGELVTVLSSINYLVYEGVEYACAFSKDITERERENRQLKLTQFSIENLHEMILWVNRDGKTLYVNSKFCRVTGYSKAECRALNLGELLIDDEGKGFDRQDWKQLKEEGELVREMDLTGKGGQETPVYCTFNYLRYESQELICIYLRDWTKKKRREIKLFMAQNALDSAQDMIFWIDEDLRIAYKNVAARERLGYKKGELKGKMFRKVCPDLNLRDIIFKENRENFETEFFTQSGKKIPVEVSVSPAEFKGNRYSCMIVRDIGERKKDQEQLMANKKKIEELSLKLKDENILLKEEIYSNYNFNNIITQNEDYRNVLGQIAQVADSDATVLIQGETGTGKELLARAIYSLSDREDRPFIKVNCAALPENLIESELFGHEKGAFTGALQQKKGRFELADKGTIFLDEIGELPLDLQAKLLRVLQEGEFERLGGTATIKVDVRIVAATNRDLEEMVEEGTFREDLFYRLNVFPISNPPLRQRKEDIPLLVKHFVNKYGKRMGRQINKISQADINELQQYHFPGNIRELENMVERAMILAKDGVLDLKASFDRVREGISGKGKGKNAFLTFEEMQKEHILEALKKCNMRVTGPKGAARLLDLNDRTLMSKMRKLGIRREDYL